MRLARPDEDLLHRFALTVLELATSCRPMNGLVAMKGARPHECTQARVEHQMTRENPIARTKLARAGRALRQLTSQRSGFGWW